MSATDPPTDPLSDETPATKAVNLIISRVTRAADEMESLLRDKGLPPGDLLKRGLDALNDATTTLRVESRNNQVARENMEEQERETEAAIVALGGNPSDFRPANLPSYLHIIARQLHQLQQHITKSESFQDIFTQSMTDQSEQLQGLNVKDAFGRILADLGEHVDEAQVRYNDSLQYMRNAEARQIAILDHLERISAKQVDSDKRVNTTVLTSMDSILEAIPVQKPLKLIKRRVHSDGDKPRDTSTAHSRKISMSSMRSAKSLAHGLFRKTGIPLHDRTTSASDLPARNSLQNRRNSWIMPRIRGSPPDQASPGHS